MKESLYTIKRALISVTDKTHLDQLAKVLHAHKVEMISTGGTQTYLESLGFPVIKASTLTGNPEAFGGRMKSISFPVTSSLLFRRHHERDIVEARELNILPIDLVVCNLYPFHAASKNKNSSEDELIENIDIGGPLMLRSAAKNYESVAVLSDVSDYETFLAKFDGSLTFDFRRRLAIKTFERIAQYDLWIADELKNRFMPNEVESKIDVTDKKWLSLESKETLRYGENPHQKAHVYHFSNTSSGKSLLDAEVLQGKELSYNNWVDADAAWRVMSDVVYISKGNNVAAVIKHANPCGLCAAPTLYEALVEAWNGDSMSSFGGVIALSHEVDQETATFLNEKFIEVVIAPAFSESALKLFAKKKNVRLLKAPLRLKEEREMIAKSISGGLLLQEEDDSLGMPEELKLVTKSKMDSRTTDMVNFGIMACKHLKSNGVALIGKNAKGYNILAGTGMGQPNRLDSLRLLAKVRVEQKKLSMKDMLLVSDAFFPFKDSIEVCHEVGIRAIIQPGGSIRDDEVIEACDEYNIAMMTTGKRHFRH